MVYTRLAGDSKAKTMHQGVDITEDATLEGNVLVYRIRRAEWHLNNGTANR